MRNDPRHPPQHSLPPSLNNSSGIADAVTGFCRLARDRGYRIGVEETLDSLKVAELGFLQDERTFRLALRTLLSGCKEERDAFDTLFGAYWRDQPEKGPPAKKEQPLGRISHEPSKSPLLSAAAATGSDPESEGRGSGGASPEERLRRTDFSRVPSRDQASLEELARRLWRRMSLRLSRRLKASRHKEQVNLRRTIRRNSSRGGDLVELCFKGKNPRKPRLALLLDVSGSMDHYSFFLLRFVYALQKHCRKVDSFAFSTRLICMTDLLQDRKLEDVLRQISESAQTWSSGTRMGDCLATFNQVHASRVLSRRALVIVLSDGLDTGEPDLLARELGKIKRRAKKLIWLNPLLGMDNYQPLARGIRTALPMVDVFQSAHNLESLLQLEDHLFDV